MAGMGEMEPLQHRDFDRHHAEMRPARLHLLRRGRQAVGAPAGQGRARPGALAISDAAHRPRAGPGRVRHRVVKVQARAPLGAKLDLERRIVGREREGWIGRQLRELVGPTVGMEAQHAPGWIAGPQGHDPRARRPKGRDGRADRRMEGRATIRGACEPVPPRLLERRAQILMRGGRLPREVGDAREPADHRIPFLIDFWRPQQDSNLRPTA